MNVKVLWAAAVVLMVVAVARGQNAHGLPDGLYAEVTMAQGVVVGELFYKQVPVTVAHYVGLVEGTVGPQKGVPFFDGARIIRVDFVIQTGETRARIPGFPDEMVPGRRHDGMGVMQMSNSGPDTNGSYWCFMMEETPRLNYLHTVFGRVVKGMEVLPKIKVGDRIEKIRILRVGTEAEKYKVDEAMFAGLVAKAKKWDEAKLPREAGPESFFDDADKVLPQPGQGSRYNRARDFNFKLGKFYLFTGEKIIAQVVGKAPEGGAEAFVEGLAGKLGVAEKGALAAYFVDADRWVVRVGRASRGEFMAGPRQADGRKAPVAADRTYEETMTAFLEEAQKTAAAMIAKEEKTTGQPVAENMRVKLKVDALLDGLIFRLEPAAAK
jgi:cyclophilin family peptidyl-prolyl cis-trans isomerase